MYLSPVCPNAPLDAGGAQQHPGDRLEGAEHLMVLWGQEPMLWPGQGVYQGDGVGCPFFPSGGAHGPFLAGSAPRPFALTDPAQKGVAVVLCGSAQAAAPLHP